MSLEELNFEEHAAMEEWIAARVRLNAEPDNMALQRNTAEARERYREALVACLAAMAENPVATQHGRGRA